MKSTGEVPNLPRDPRGRPEVLYPAKGCDYVDHLSLSKGLSCVFRRAPLGAAKGFRAGAEGPRVPDLITGEPGHLDYFSRSRRVTRRPLEHLEGKLPVSALQLRVTTDNRKPDGGSDRLDHLYDSKPLAALSVFLPGAVQSCLGASQSGSAVESGVT
jgi:hypothetical protein